MSPDDTQITEHAIQCFVHFLRDSRRNGPRATGDMRQEEYAFARTRLRKLMSTAGYRASDAQGRELWRSPSSAYGLRWLLVYEQDRRIRKVIWVGTSRPPKAMWQEIK